MLGTVQGSTLTSIETTGIVSLFADNNGYLYASIPGSDATAGIYAWGMQLEQSMWGHLEVIGAEQVDGTNYLAWKIDDYQGRTNYELWEMSSDWSEWIDSRWIQGGSLNSIQWRSRRTSISMVMERSV